MLEVIIVICLGIIMIELAAIGEFVSDLKQIMVQLYGVIEVYEGEEVKEHDD